MPPVITSAEARAALAEAGITQVPPEVAAWIDYMVNQSAELADTLTNEIYEQTKAAVEQPRDPVALKAAEKMWKDEARRRAETLATNMTQTQLKQIGQTIADGLEAGLGPKEIARNLDAVKGLDANRAAQYLKMEEYLEDSDLSAEEIERKLERYYQQLLNDRKETIARTEAREATAEAALQKNRDRGARFKVWITAGDDRVSDECQGNEAEGPIPIDDEFSGGVDRPPQHPNCLVAETPVFAPDKRAAFITAYSGPVVEIGLSGARSVTVTPNHMFLTPFGFAAAKSLLKGDKIFNSPIVERIVTGDPENHRLPTRIDQVIDAFAEARGMSREAVPLSPEYLHGDARFAKGHIDVIASDSFLHNHIKPARAKSISEIDLSVADAELFGLARCRDFLSMLFGLRDATDGGMGLRRESETFLRRHSRKAQLVSIMAGSNRKTGTFDPSGDSGPRVSRLDADGKYRDAGFISLAEVLYIKFRYFEGHVYDLHTDSSLYCAGSLISSNCRCTLSYITSDEQLERAETRAKDRAAKTAAAKEGEDA